MRTKIVTCTRVKAPMGAYPGHYGITGMHSMMTDRVTEAIKSNSSIPHTYTCTCTCTCRANMCALGSLHVHVHV